MTLCSLFIFYLITNPNPFWVPSLFILLIISGPLTIYWLYKVKDLALEHTLVLLFCYLNNLPIEFIWKYFINEKLSNIVLRYFHNNIVFKKRNLDITALIMLWQFCGQSIHIIDYLGKYIFSFSAPEPKSILTNDREYP